MDFNMRRAATAIILALTILLIILFSILYIIFAHSTTYSENFDEGWSDNSHDFSDNQTDQQDENANNADNQKEKFYPVLCELGTATWCKYCPVLGEKIFDIYGSGKYPIYLVSLVYDKCAAAQDRLDNDYNIYGFPTLFIDGGKRIIYGSEASEREIENAISEVAREVKKNISIDISFDVENNETIDCIIKVKNNENDAYSGLLKVYLVEINSRWYDYDGKPYRYTLVDFIINKGIDVSDGGEKSISSRWTAPKDFKPLDEENLMLIAVLFSDKTVEKFSDPPKNQHPFEARFVDAIASKRLSEGNLPPQIGVSLPKEGMIHFRSKPLFKNWLGGTVVIGKTVANFTVRDEGDFIKIRIYVDDVLKGVILERELKGEKTYYFRIPSTLLGKHTLRIEAIDENGKSADVVLPFFSILVL